LEKSAVNLCRKEVQVIASRPEVVCKIDAQKTTLYTISDDFFGDKAESQKDRETRDSVKYKRFKISSAIVNTVVT